MPSQQSGPDQRRLAEAAAAEQLALHVDDRVPRAQGQPEGHQGLGRSGEARDRGDHAEPEDVRRRALELPGGLGIRAAAARRQRRQGARVRHAALHATCRCSIPAPAARPTTFVQRGIGDVLLAWENEAYLALQEAEGQGRDRRPVDQHPRRAAGRGRRQGRRQERHAGASPRRTCSTSTRREGQEIAAKHHYRPRDPNVAAKYAASSPR